MTTTFGLVISSFELSDILIRNLSLHAEMVRLDVLDSMNGHTFGTQKQTGKALELFGIESKAASGRNNQPDTLGFVRGS